MTAVGQPPTGQLEDGIVVNIIVNQPVLNNEGTEMRLPGTVNIDGGFTQPRVAGGWIDGALVGDGTIGFLKASGSGDKPITECVLARPERCAVHDVTDGKPPREKVVGDLKQAVVGAIIRLRR